MKNLTIILCFFTAIISCNSFTNKHNFDNDIILSKIISLLKEQASNKNEIGIDDKGYFKGFFIYDVVDTTNIQTTEAYYWANKKKLSPIKFIDGHIYRFSCDFGKDSFDNILFLNKDSVIVFEATECNCFDNENNKMLQHFEETYKGSDKELIRRKLTDYWTEKYHFIWAYGGESSSSNCDTLKVRLNGRSIPRRNLLE